MLVTDAVGYTYTVQAEVVATAHKAARDRKLAIENVMAGWLRLLLLEREAF